eukprot:3476589-Pyramimonas_sp.AAC.1
MRVCLSIPELGTRSAARTRFARQFYYSSRYCRFSALNSGCRGAAGLVMTGADSQTLDTSACRIKRSELESP